MKEHRQKEDSREDPVQTALEMFLPKLPEGPLRLEDVALGSALGRVLGKAVETVLDSPPYSRSIMEGFVVHCADLAKASADSPAILRIIGAVLPGTSEAKGFSPGTALGVTTGSFVPDGDVAVVRKWDVEQKGEQVVVKKPAQKGENIETRGCDRKKGDPLVPKGKKLDPDDIYLLASQGILQVTVASRPKVAVFSSGNEVLPPNEPIRPGWILDCNGLGLSAQVEQAGGKADFKGIMRDDFETFLQKIQSALAETDMVLISGGTAVGGRDFIAELVQAAGQPGTVVNGVPMRSGKPIVLGIVGKKPIVCVAGHPPEAARGFRLFGHPTLTRLLGAAEGK